MKRYKFQGKWYSDVFFRIKRKGQPEEVKNDIYGVIESLMLDHIKCQKMNVLEPFEALYMSGSDESGNFISDKEIFENTGRGDNQCAFAKLHLLPIHVRYLLEGENQDQNHGAEFFDIDDMFNAMKGIQAVWFSVINFETSESFVQDDKFTGEVELKPTKFGVEADGKSKAIVKICQNGKEFEFTAPIITAFKYLKSYYESLSENPEIPTSLDNMPEIWWESGSNYKPIWVHCDETSDSDYYDEDNMQRVLKLVSKIILLLKLDLELKVYDPVEDEMSESYKYIGNYLPGAEVK